MKRYLIAGAVALTIGGGTFAFANSLTVSSDTLASGTDTVDSGCESVDVSYTAAYVSNSYELDTITLTGDDTACANKAYRVTVADSAGVSLHEITGTLNATGDADDIDVAAADVDASEVENISAVVTG